MAIDLAKLIAPQWTFRSETAGEWDVYRYSVKAAFKVDEYSSGEISDPIEAVRALIGVMCKSHTGDHENGDSGSARPTLEDLTAFTEKDINDFSHQFLKNDSSLEAAKDMEKPESQSEAEFFLDVLKAENKKNSFEGRDTFSALYSSLEGLVGSKNSGIRGVGEDLIRQNKELERIYSPKPSMLETSPSLFVSPPNPIHETNDRLGDMTERLENLVEFGEHALQIMNGLQIASAEFLENFSIEAEKNSRAAKIAIRVGLFAIAISICQILYTEFWRVPRDTASMDAALDSVRGEIDDLQAALGADLADYQEAQAVAATAVAVSVDSTIETNTVLLKRIDLLLKQQRARDEALIEALGAISEAAHNSAE